MDNPVIAIVANISTSSTTEAGPLDALNFTHPRADYQFMAEQKNK